MAADIFVSYSRKDRDAVKAWVRGLRAHGITVWLDEEAIGPAALWSREICEAIETCKLFLLMLSSSSTASEHVHREVALAMDHRKPILPLYLEPATVPSELRYPLAGLQHLELFRLDESQAYETLLRTLARFGLEGAPRPETGVVRPGASDPQPPEFQHQVQASEVRSAADSPPRPVEIPNNLPRLLTSFIGRAREIEEARRLLPSTCLLTFAGPGGCGKTRLALQIAADVLDQHVDGVWLVELETLAEGSLVAPTIASVLGIHEEPGRPITATLADFLRPRSVLLILDNCEHVISPCAQLTAALLRACPDLRIMATSREPLGVPGETVIRVATLALPDRRALKATGADLVKAVLQSEAAQLFVERARTAAPAFEVAEQNARAVAQVCLRLDGIPLAIELAAARVKVLAVEQIAKRLDDRFRLLTGGSRTVLPRQQTLRATIDWSYELLSDVERVLLRRLSVFVGGWSLAGAEAITVGEAGGAEAGVAIEEWEVLDLLTQLVDKSLVAVEEGEGGEARYALLETVRQYCQEKQQQAGEDEVLRPLYHDFFLGWAEEARPHLDGPEQAAWFDRLEIEHDNLRAVLEGLFAASGLDAAARICLAVMEFWWQRGWVREGREMFARCLAEAERLQEPQCRIYLLGAAGWGAYLQADHEQAAQHLGDCLALCRELSNRQGEANALNDLALTAQAQGRPADARALLEQSLAIVRELGDERKQAARLSNLGFVAIQAGEYEQAQQYLVEAQTIYGRLGIIHGKAACLCNLAELALRRQEWDQAESLAQQSLEQFRLLDDRHGIAHTLANLAEAAMNRSDTTAADRHVHEALTVCVEIGRRGLIPHLLEIRTRCQLVSGAPEQALFTLTVAERLRHELCTPRTSEEQEALEPVLVQLRSVLVDECVEAIKAAVTSLTLEGVISQVLAPTLQPAKTSTLPVS